MAKSLRSKRQRQCRAVKRIRYGAKELVKLKKILGIDDTKNEVDMKEVSEVATVLDAAKVKQDVASNTETKTEDEGSMETDEKKRNFNPKTLKDQHGSYPSWMHPRRIRAFKKSSKKAAKIAKKKKK